MVNQIYSKSAIQLHSTSLTTLGKFCAAIFLKLAFLILECSLSLDIKIYESFSSRVRMKRMVSTTTIEKNNYVSIETITSSILPSDGDPLDSLFSRNSRSKAKLSTRPFVF
jgi:hypothetical protein